MTLTCLEKFEQVKKGDYLSTGDSIPFLAQVFEVGNSYFTCRYWNKEGNKSFYERIFELNELILLRPTEEGKLEILAGRTAHYRISQELKRKKQIVPINANK